MRNALLCLSLLAGFIGCGADSAVDPSAGQYATIAGVYALKTFEGKPIPYGDPKGVEIISISLKLFGEGNFFETIVSRNHANGDFDWKIESAGTFTATLTSIQLTPTWPGPAAGFSGSVSGSTLALTIPGNPPSVYVFAKQ